MARVHAAEEVVYSDMLPMQAGPAHPGQRPLPEDNETQKEYGKRIDAWEKQMKAYEASGQLVQEEEQKEGAARAQERSDFSVDTPDEGFAAWLMQQRTALRKRAPKIESAMGQQAITQIGKMILPDVEPAIREISSPTDRLFSGGTYLLREGLSYTLSDVYGNNETIVREQYDLRRAVLSPDGRRLAIHFDQDIHLHTLPFNQKNYHRIKLNSQYPGKIYFSPDGRYLAYSIAFSNAPNRSYSLVWDTLILNQAPRKFKNAYARGNAFSGDSRYFAVQEQSRWSNKVVLWDLSGRGENIIVPNSIKGDKELALHFSDNGNYMAFDSGNRMAFSKYRAPGILWDLRAGKQLFAYNVVDKDIAYDNAAIFSPNSRYFAVKVDKGINLYDLRQKGKEPLHIGNDDATRIAFSPDSRYVLLMLRRRLEIYDLLMPAHLIPLNPKVLEDGRGFFDMTFALNGKYLIVMLNHVMQVWNWALLVRDMEKERLAVW